MKQPIIILFLITCGLFSSAWMYGQNNVGIGTKKPDLTAIMHVADSNRGFLVPRTDTQSVWNYVNTLSPNPGITHGLTIFEVNERMFYIYNGIKNKWEPINSLQGPKGPTGPTGPTGDRGALGITTQWRDSSRFPPFKVEERETDTPKWIPPYNMMLGDTCGDFYHQTSTGLIWVYDCINHTWGNPVARWRTLGPTIMEDFNSAPLIVDSMAEPGDTTMKFLTGLNTVIRVPPDTIAYIHITAEGSVQKTVVNDSATNLVKFDFFMIDKDNNSGYLNRSQIISVGPNSTPTPPSTVSVFDKASWMIGTVHTFEGKISTPGNPLPPNDYNNWTFQVHYKQIFSPDNPRGVDGEVFIVDGQASGIYESFAVMNVSVTYERSPNALKP